MMGVAAVLLVAVLPAPPIVADAVAARVEAEQALARFREARVERAAGALRRVEQAQSALVAARARADRAVAAVEAAERVADRGAAAAADRARRIDALRALLAEVEGVDARLDALAAQARVEVEARALHDRAGRSATAPVIRVGPVRLAAGETAATVGLVTRDAAGLRVAGPVLSPAEAAAVRAYAAGEGATLPLDLSGELIGHTDVEPWTLAGWLAAGGPFVWPIVALALAALLVAIERAWALSRDRARPGLLDAALGPDRAAARAALTGETALARVLRAGLAEPRGPTRDAALEAALAAEDLRLDRGLRLLAVFAGVAPLLGLLGTVSGMIGTFDVIAVHGTGEPRLMSGGIAQALTTTQLGLMVAVPTLLAHAVLARLAERRRGRLEAAAARLSGVV